MKVSENTLKWAMRFYPPLFFQRIWTRSFYPGFKGVEVTVKPSVFNRNYNASIFGGTLFSATDPFYALLFDQIFRRKGFKTRIWLKSASIHFIRPSFSRMSFRIQLSDHEVQEAEKTLLEVGKYNKCFPIEVKDKTGQICVKVHNEVYIQVLNLQEIRKNNPLLK